MKEKKKSPFNIFSTEIPVFKQLMMTLDSLHCELSEKGVGATSQLTQPVTKDDIGHPTFCPWIIPKACRTLCFSIME